MRERKREFDIFNLSFLDIISCGFGAVVMLILVSKPQDDIATAGKDQVQDMLQSMLSLKNSVTQMQQNLEAQLASGDELNSANASLAKLASSLKAKAEKQKRVHKDLEGDLEGLALVESTLNQASMSTPKQASGERDDEVGGIPVDSDYVVFIVDTSGSMQQIWRRVSTQVINVLNIHPEVKGFQILNDMGKSIISGYTGKWIPDTPGRRNSVIKLFDNWGDYSNSSPVEGIEAALKFYAKPDITMSIYVFGDDYTGSSYDPVIDKITKQNTSPVTGKKLAKIHGVGFRSIGTTDHFSILMRELTKRNGGTYLALP